MTQNALESEDPVLMLRAMTMAFMVMLSRQPNMACEFTSKVMREFPFDHYRLSAISDPDGTQTFMLLPDDEGQVM